MLLAANLGNDRLMKDEVRQKPFILGLHSATELVENEIEWRLQSSAVRPARALSVIPISSTVNQLTLFVAQYISL